MFSKKAIKFMAVSMLITFATLISGTFVNIFMWKITSDVIAVAKYNIVTFIILTVTLPVFGYISKRFSVTLVFRISIIYQILYFASIILSGEYAGDYIYGFGILSGISAAAGANSGNQLTVLYTEPENRSKFLSISGALNSIAAMISPLLAGAIIAVFDEFAGYYVIFTISMTLFIISFVMTAWFNEKIPKREFSFFTTMFNCSALMKKVNSTQVLIGIRDGVFGFLINILVFDIVKTEGVFGIVTSFAKLIVVLVFWFGGKIIRKNNLYKHLKYAMWIMFAAPIPLFLFSNQFGVLAQMIMDSVAAPLVAITLNSLMFNKIESSVKNDNLIELLALKEVNLNIGKVLGVTGFIIFYPMLELKWIFILVMVTNLCYVASYYIYKGYKK